METSEQYDSTMCDANGAPLVLGAVYRMKDSISTARYKCTRLESPLQRTILERTRDGVQYRGYEFLRRAEDGTYASQLEADVADDAPKTFTPTEVEAMLRGAFQMGCEAIRNAYPDDGIWDETGYVPADLYDTLSEPNEIMSNMTYGWTHNIGYQEAGEHDRNDD